MEDSLMGDGPERMVDRLAQATNAHDLDALVDCVAADYRNETPLHPSRSFVGREQVRRNWEQIFTHVPDLHASVVRRAVSGDSVWSEWEMRGTRRDGAAHLMRGVIIFEVCDHRAASARFYLEPAQDTGESVTDAVRDTIAPARSGAP